MQQSPEFLQKLTEIFDLHKAGYLAVKDKTVPAEQRATVMSWFNDVLLYFKIFGYHTGFEKTFILPSVVAYDLRRLADKVSINSFCLIEINNLNGQILALRWPDRDHWSHPGVRDFIASITEGSLKRHLYRIGRPDLWVVAKFFCNTICGALAGRHTTLCVADIPQWSSKKPYDSIVDAVIESTGQKERLVAADGDVLVFACPTQDIDPSIVEQRWVALSDDMGELNRVCRKLKIDIVK